MIRNIKSFFAALGINMAFRYRYLYLVVLAVILYFAAGTPLWTVFAVLLVWVLHALIVTLLVSFAAGCNNVPRNQKGIRLHPGRNADFDKMYRPFSSDGPLDH